MFPDSADKWKEQQALFGRDAIKLLHKLYGQSRRHRDGRIQAPVIELSEGQILAEWEQFKRELWRLKCDGMSLDNGYKVIFACTAYPTMQLLACIYHVNVNLSVVAETGFSLMNAIKTKLRSCMQTSTLDDLMQIASNAPKFSGDEQAIEALIERAYQHWAKAAKRCLARSHPGVSRARKAKAKSIPLTDLLNEEIRAERIARAERHACAMRAFDSDADEDDSDLDEDAEGDDVQLLNMDELIHAHGSYQPPAGYKVLPAPSKDVHQLLHT